MHENWTSFARPGTHRTVALPDRTVRLVGVRGYFPDVSPNGRVAYTEGLPQPDFVKQYGTPPIVTSRLDGSARQVVLPSDSLPAWGTSTCFRNGHIAFSTGPDFAPPDAPVDIWALRPDGSNLTNLTSDSTANDAFPAWSSDCEHIVFRSGRDGNKEIHRMRADGSDSQRLTNHPATDTAPSLSPDGEWGVFSTNRAGTGFKLRIQRIDGTEGRFLEPNRVGPPGIDMHPQFSPDGRWILFISARSNVSDE